ncbi:PREDICTED: uncharacterized protein LOC105564898 [Vollenhovia emeryi]|uniref:uncharacterized protein LOC105564898 n=1 Tax=Vollenhovia emeryi TaxID=411798 RepID=UPI0005F535DD|nr:PREDICTED: uncharacterized protein LOC105564898 [Vollenhovia emeryi]
MGGLWDSPLVCRGEINNSSCSNSSRPSRMPPMLSGRFLWYLTSLETMNLNGRSPGSVLFAGDRRSIFRNWGKKLMKLRLKFISAKQTCFSRSPRRSRVHRMQRSAH